jgi:hypothetical protein
MADQRPMPAPVRVTPGRIVGTEPGDLVGGYELLREVGRGGMAEVWVARRAHSSTGKFVAIKMVLPQHVGDERYSGMFRSEAEVSAPLSHGNIVQVFDEGEDQGRSFLVMEWVDGVDLARLLPDMLQLQQRDPYLRLRVAAYIVGQVLHGLSYAHKITSHRGAQLGIVHRDISPQNILVSVSGDVKVTDFGIAHRMIEETSGLHVKGKLRYMPPEQLGGQSHAPTVDLYAVGAVLHELLDGEKFRGDAKDQMSLYRQVMGGVIPALRVSDVPPELDAVRVALLQPDPDRRPQTADAALLLLKRWAGYSEMKVELAMICGLATGVVRPRTGPLVEAGQPTVPPPRSGVPVFVPRPEPDAPVARWTFAAPIVAPTAVLAPSTIGAAPASAAGGTPCIVGGDASARRARDLEPTHSAAALPTRHDVPVVESTLSQLEATRVHAAPRVWMILVAFALLAIVGGGTTAWLRLADRSVSQDVATAELVPAAEAIVASPHEPSPAYADGPRLEPVVAPPVAVPLVPVSEVAVSEVAAAPVDPTEHAATIVDEAADIVAPDPRGTESRRRTTSKAKPAPKVKPRPVARPAAPSGPEVIVRFRLDGDLKGADVRLGSRVIEVRPHYDTRVASGTHTVQWRASASDPWRDAGRVTIGSTGEWKFFIGRGGARVSRV